MSAHKVLCNEHNKPLASCKCMDPQHNGVTHRSCPPRYFKLHEMEMEEEEKLLADHHQAILDSILEFD